MSSYKELQAQIAALQKQAEQVRKQEIASVVAEIKAKMAEYGITLEDLGATGKSAGRRKSTGGVVKYRDPATGATWTGKGRKPGWMVEALAAGKKMEDFLV